MMICGSRTTLERQAIRQLIAGMRETFPTLATSWLVAVEHTTDWHNLGRHIAETLQAQHAPSPSNEPVLHFLPPPPSNDTEWVKQVHQLQSALAQEQKRSASANAEARHWQHEYVQAQQRAEAQRAQMADELCHLRRIVAEQHLQLQTTAGINPVQKSEGH